MANEIELAKLQECKHWVSVMFDVCGKVFGYETLAEVLKSEYERVKGKAAGEALEKFRAKVL